MKILLDKGLLHGECKTIYGNTIEEQLKNIPNKPKSDQKIIRPFDDPVAKEGHLVILKGNLAQEVRIIIKKIY